MSQTVTKKLPSGAELKITASPFKEALALHEAVLIAMQPYKIEWKASVDFDLFKNILCATMTSPQVKACLAECMKRATYNGKHIDDDTFESIEARAEYQTVFVNVMVENIAPFMKNLYALSAVVLEQVAKALA